MRTGCVRFPATVNRVHFAVTGSTNAWAREHEASLDKESLTVVTADHQTDGVINAS